MNKYFLFVILLLPSMLSASISSDAQGQQLLEIFSSASNTWVNAIKPAGLFIFGSFVVIDMVITFGFIAFRGTELGEIIGELIRKILWIGFFLMLFQSANLLDKIPASFDKLALQGSGRDIQPDVILEQAIDLVGQMWSALDFSVESLVMVFAGIICLIAFALMAAQLFVVLVKIQALIAGSYLIFAFGGLSYTRSMAINPLKAIFAAGMEMMFIKLFLSLTVATIENMTANVGNDQTSALVIIVVSILLASVVYMIPGIVSALMSGTLGGNSTSGLGVAAAAAGGAMAGGALAAKSGVGMSDAVKSAKELASAGEGSTFGNLVKSMGKDVVDSLAGKNARDTTSTGQRAADYMKKAASSINEAQTAAQARTDAGYVNSIDPGAMDGGTSYSPTEAAELGAFEETALKG